jgi:hypothetical protein
MGTRQSTFIKIARVAAGKLVHFFLVVLNVQLNSFDVVLNGEDQRYVYTPLVVLLFFPFSNLKDLIIPFSSFILFWQTQSPSILMAPTHTGSTNPSSNLQIPDSSILAPSRQYSSSRPVSVSPQPTSVPPSQPSTRKRASHSVQSSQQQTDHHQPGYHDLHSHPAAVAYTAAHPNRTIPRFGPYLLLQTLGEGEFGKVKLGLHNQWGEEVAVKLIRKGNIDMSVRMSKVEREIEVLRVSSPTLFNHRSFQLTHGFRP